MDKPAKPKSNNILKFLPRAATVVSFQNPPFSPKRSDTTSSKSKPHRGFSGPIISIIPAEARRQRTKSDAAAGNGFNSQQEPTSPKISCMGQIKHKHTKTTKSIKPKSDVSSANPKKPFMIQKMFSSKKLGRTKSDVIIPGKPPLPERGPPLSQMRRFASGRDAFADFDWTAKMERGTSDDRKSYCCDEDEEDSKDEENKGVVIIPMMVGGGVSLQPKKEVNLWKRRTMAPPPPPPPPPPCPLQLN